MIELPDKFEKDVQGKDTYLVPLIIIDDRIYLSTNQISLENNYDPLIKSIGTIKESINIEKKNFKISSVSLDFYNYEYNDETLSNRLFNKSVMNTKLDIYFKSQSAESIDECLKVYTGYVKDIKETSETLEVEAEDKTEQTLHKKLPTEHVRDDIDIPDRYYNEIVPIVYGVVEKAPCVYYDLYSTNIEDGATDYALSPDSFAIKSIDNPYVFTDDVYLGIEKFTDLFQDISEGTIYKNATFQQYSILGNRILFQKTIETDDDAEIEGLSASPIAFNFVEVKNESKLTYSGGTYSLNYTLLGEEPVEAKVPIKMFKDIDGTIPSTNLQDQPYLDVKDFSDMPEDVAIPEYWLWGDNNWLPSTYSELYGESLINFESERLCKEGDIVKKIRTNIDGDTKDAWGWINLKYDLETEIDSIMPSDELPSLFLRWTDGATSIWYIHEAYLTGDIYSSSGYTGNYEKTYNISNNMFSIGQRKLTGDSFNVYPTLDGSMKYLKINDLKITRTLILNNFINHDIYAYVEGRVDNVEGKYTQNPQLTSEQRTDHYQGRTITKAKSSIKAFKPIKALKPIKKGSKY